MCTLQGIGSVMKRSLSFESEDTNTNSQLSELIEESAPGSDFLSSLNAPVSPPRRGSAVGINGTSTTDGIPSHDDRNGPSLAAVEAGQLQVSDPLTLFSARLAQASQAYPASEDHHRLSIENWVDLYSRNQNAQGRHFVIHQHDHPIAGPHYDLRLQFSESSSLSWAIMYGLPGDPNSKRLNRNATETRVHCVWNHLIETASAGTGSMIIWDTGEYEILPYYPAQKDVETDDSRSDLSEESSAKPPLQQQSDSEKLREAFQNRKLRLRLHGSRLPHNYTISLRLSKEDDDAARARPLTKKRRKRRRTTAFFRPSARTPSTSPERRPEIDSGSQSSAVTTPMDNKEEDIGDNHSASASDGEDMDERIRQTNAYPGATNSIGSIHQRRWFITLDRLNSGFIQDREKKAWVRRSDDGKSQGFEPFYVRGPEIERSVVTGRTGYDVLKDEEVEEFIPRQGWRAVVE